MAVNIFVLISGYFGIRLTSKKTLSLILQIIIYTFLLTTLPYLLQGDIRSAIVSCLFISHTKYWFVKYYLLLMFFAPLLNNLFENTQRKYLTYFCLLLLLVSCYFGFLWQDVVNKNGYTFFNFLTLYCLGRYIHKYNIRLKTRYALPIYVICSLITAVVFYYLFCTRVDLCWRMTYYNSPFVIAAALGLFLVFLNLNFQSPLLNRLSKSTFAIYLISCSAISVLHYKIIAYYYTQTYNNFLIFLLLILFALIFSLLAFLIDPIQRKLNTYIIDKLEKIKPINKFINNEQNIK